MPKDSERVEAYGTVDELNSMLGLLLCETLSEDVRAALTRIQHSLFDLGGELCIPGRSVLTETQVTELEQVLDLLNEKLAPLKEFILPGGTRAAAVCHIARTVCRRAERRVYTLSKREVVPVASLKYLNRLSDLLFVLARALNHAAGAPDVLWQPAAAPVAK